MVNLRVGPIISISHGKRGKWEIRSSKIKKNGQTVGNKMGDFPLNGKYPILFPTVFVGKLMLI